ncbi:MAG: hypothetical protein JNM72_18840 [Deltaproteobacteria bacterium]|nr:hypothetical protein [Deltaproteobacteria bacterium]
MRRRPARPHLRRALGLALGGLSLSPAVASAAAVGDPVPEALAVHLTRGGLDHLGDALQALLPPVIPIEASSGSIACVDGEPPLDWALAPLDMQLSVDEVRLDPSSGALLVTLYVTLSSSASTLTVVGDCSVLTDLDESCAVELPTTALQVDLALAISESAGVFTATASPATLSVSPIGNPLDGCVFASAIGTMLGQDPLLISDLIEEAAAPSLDGLGPTLEAGVEDSLNALRIDTTVALLDTTLALSLAPSLLELSERGLVLGLGAEITPSTLSDCVDSSGGSSIGGGWPELSETAGDTSLPYDAGLLLGADFIDHTLFSAWASGALCLDAGSLLGAVVADGLTADFVAGFVGEDFEALFPADNPAWLTITAPSPPTTRFTADNPPLHVDIPGMEVELYSVLDHRKVRAFQATGDADIGLDLTLSGDTLSTALVLQDPAIDLVESYSELLGPGYSDGIEALLSSFLGGLIPAELLPTISVPLPLGLGVESLQFVPQAEGRWQGAHARLDLSGVTPVELSGCSLDGFGCDGGDLGIELDPEAILGCDDTSAGCADAACATAPAGLRARAARGRLGLGLLVVGALGLLRRRR